MKVSGVELWCNVTKNKNSQTLKHDTNCSNYFSVTKLPSSRAINVMVKLFLLLKTVALLLAFLCQSYRLQQQRWLLLWSYVCCALFLCFYCLRQILSYWIVLCITIKLKNILILYQWELYLTYLCLAGTLYIKIYLCNLF